MTQIHSPQPPGAGHIPPPQLPAPGGALHFHVVSARCPKCGTWRAQVAAPPRRMHCPDCHAWIEVQIEGYALRRQRWTLVFPRGWQGIRDRKKGML